MRNNAQMFGVRNALPVFILLLSISSVACAQRVHTGAEVLLEKHLDLLGTARIGVVCNHTSVLPSGTHLVDTLRDLGVNITALFSPEHGIRGTFAAGVMQSDSSDRRTGLPVYSLYGRTRKPTPAMLANVDILLFDLQDVGSRFYTYASTMAYAMQAAAEQGKKFVLLDRPNPINGVRVDGPVLDTALRSFVGMFPVPVRPGLTLGELAKMIVGEHWMNHLTNIDLSVIPMEGWKRDMWFDSTGLPWVSPSPNIKTLATATVYPGTCLFEATNVSEGRGTSHPFEYIGAPWINAERLSNALVRDSLSGLAVSPIEFTPRADSIAAPDPKYRDVQCHGLSLVVTDRNRFDPVGNALKILCALRTLYPDSLRIDERYFERLWGKPGIPCPPAPSVPDGTFLSNREKFLIY